MSDIISYSPVRALDGNGNPVPGALARFFRSNTTTPATVYADVAEQVPHPVPLEADGNGVFPPVYRSGEALRVVMTDASGVTLPGFPMDPVISVAAEGGAASQIGFDPTAEIPVTNVQAAIERVQSNLVAPLLAGGLGVTGNAPTLANVDATDTASGFYRWTDSATGTLPPGWSGETGTIWLFRETASNAIQFIARRDIDALFYRALEGGTWGAWARYDVRTLPDADWEDGTSNTFASPSPAQVGKAIAELVPELTPAQVIDREDDTKGLVSGEDMAAAVVANGGWELIETRDPLVSGANNFTGLAGWRDIMVHTIEITGSTSDTSRRLRVSSNNGATYISDSIYGTVNTGGNSGHARLSDNGSGARSVTFIIHGFGTDWISKPVTGGRTTDDVPGGIHSSAVFNALQVYTTDGTITGGAIMIFGRR